MVLFWRAYKFGLFFAGICIRHQPGPFERKRRGFHEKRGQFQEATKARNHFQQTHQKLSAQSWVVNVFLKYNFSVPRTIPRVFDLRRCGHRRRIPWKSLLKDQTVNKFPSSFFTTKTGLYQSLQHLHWYSPQPVSTFFPRCHQVGVNYCLISIFPLFV